MIWLRVLLFIYVASFVGKALKITSIRIFKITLIASIAPCCNLINCTPQFKV